MTPMRGKAPPLRDWLGRTAHADPHVTAATKGAQPQAMKIWKAKALVPPLRPGKESRRAAVGNGTGKPPSPSRRAATRPYAACLPAAALLISAS